MLRGSKDIWVGAPLKELWRVECLLSWTSESWHWGMYYGDCARVLPAEELRVLALDVYTN